MDDLHPQRALVIKADGTVPFDPGTPQSLIEAYKADLNRLGIPHEPHPQGLRIPNHRAHVHKFHAHGEVR